MTGVTNVIDKDALFERYDEILERGCLDEGQRRRLHEGGQIEGVVVQQSGGSGGGEPLRLPRTQEEMNWLAMKLAEHYVARYQSFPQRTALLGGISHTAAQQRIEVGGNMKVGDFAGDQLADLDAFSPDVISMYPSFAREIVADSTLRLPGIKAIKLGGEPILPSDLRRLWDRFGPIPVVEQFGSTEMPGLAFRTYTPDSGGDYRLSVDRYDFDFKATDEWQRLIVRDRFAGRAFPIEDWYNTGDEVLLREGVPVAFRRHGDPTFDLRGGIDALLVDGCVNVQMFPRESRVLCARTPTDARGEVSLGGSNFELTVEAPYRLIDSNKMPLSIDTQKVDRARLFRYAETHTKTNG